MPGKAQTTGSSLELDVDNSGGGGGGDATAANQIIEIAVLQDIETDVSDVSTETTLALIKSKTDNIDVALSTRTKPSDQQHVIVDSGSVTTGGLTDTQLRATPVPISGTVTANVTNPLPVSATSLPLPTGAALEAGNLATIAGKDFATQTTLALIKARTDNIDVALSTRTKPADAQHTIIDSGTISTLPALVAGTALIGKVGIDQTTPGTTNNVSVGAIAVSSSVTSVNDSASSQQLLASTAGRKGYKLFNDSTIVGYVKEGTTATTSDYSYKIQPQGFYESVGLGVYTGRIDCIWASDGSGAMKITELT